MRQTGERALASSGRHGFPSFPPTRQRRSTAGNPNAASGATRADGSRAARRGRGAGNQHPGRRKHLDAVGRGSRQQCARHRRQSLPRPDGRLRSCSGGPPASCRGFGGEGAGGSPPSRTGRRLCSSGPRRSERASRSSGAASRAAGLLCRLGSRRGGDRAEDRPPLQRPPRNPRLRSCVPWHDLGSAPGDFEAGLSDSLHRAAGQPGSPSAPRV